MLGYIFQILKATTNETSILH